MRECELRAKESRTTENLLGIIQRSEDASVVRSAIIDLGYSADEKAYRALVKQLDHPSLHVQHAAVLSLGRLGRTQAITELVKPKIYRSRAANIRWAAVAAIGKLGDFRVIHHLLKAVEDPEWIVRTQAVAEVKGKVQDILDRKDTRLARILVNMLSLENEEIVDLAVDGFRELGLESLPLLLEALNNSSPVIRKNAARALGKLKSPQATPHLIHLLQDSQWQVRASAAEALGFIKDKSSVETLVQQIDDNVGSVQEAVADAIVHFGPLATMSVLNALGRVRDKYALKALLGCLGRIGDVRAVPALTDHLRSSYFVVRHVAVESLIRFGPSGITALLPTLSFNRSNIDTLKRDATTKERPELQLRAVKALGGLEDHRAVPLLKELVASGLPEVQDAAIEALSQIGRAAWGRCCALRILAEVGSASLVPLIAPSFQDDSDNVRLEAVRALGKLGGSLAVKKLIHAAKTDESPDTRMEAVRALRKIGAGQPGILETALHCLKDTSRDVRSQAARLLGIIPDKKAIQPLLKAISDPHWSVRESAENALLNFGRDAVGPLIEALGHRRWTTRFRAARLLGETGDLKAVPELKKILARKGERIKVRQVAEASLRKLNS